MGTRFDKWDDAVHDDFEQLTRQDRAKNEDMEVLEINRKTKEATIRSAGKYKSVYHVSMSGCSCPDFQERGLPCKHMYRLENELPVSKRKKSVMLLLTILLGYIGAHRFYAGRIGSGILWLFTGGIFFVGWIVDIVTVCKNQFKDGSGLVITSEVVGGE